ncbi:ATP-binding protein [Methylomonas sp. DH-1]|uniref:ATP-binding protein n=1 Tax=Methylomonas sp. (strain DH-1) TaxID=1727196 RepID=UPI001E3FF2AF|nr:ATP-binding protein [Methylomonas sp. DH-1]
MKLCYSEFKDEPRYWDISDAEFSKINLIVGKNSSGKSRLMSVINSFARILCGQHKAYEACGFLVTLKLNSGEFSYEIAFKEGTVIKEVLLVDGEKKLSRDENGSGQIHYEKENTFLDFKIPANAIAAVNRRDEIQHPFLIELYQWANSVVLYLFGSDFGRSRVMGVTDAHAFFNNPNPPPFDDPDDFVRVYSSAYKRFGETFDKAVIADMGELGYSLSDVGADNLQELSNFPFAAVGIFVVETDLGFKNPQIQMSQGMFRALALVVHLNLCAFSRNKQLILVDDIGEGLDYERATSVIKLLITKAKENDMQLIMTTNDRFVMNEVPLEYWAVLKRKGGIVKMFNAKNSQKQFEQFKYLGLNNFDFFASDFFEAEVLND